MGSFWGWLLKQILSPHLRKVKFIVNIELKSLMSGYSGAESSCQNLSSTKLSFAKFGSKRLNSMLGSSS